MDIFKKIIKIALIIILAALTKISYAEIGDIVGCCSLYFNYEDGNFATEVLGGMTTEEYCYRPFNEQFSYDSEKISEYIEEGISLGYWDTEYLKSTKITQLNVDYWYPSQKVVYQDTICETYNPSYTTYSCTKPQCMIENADNCPYNGTKITLDYCYCGGHVYDAKGGYCNLGYFEIPPNCTNGKITKECFCGDTIYENIKQPEDGYCFEKTIYKECTKENLSQEEDCICSDVIQRDGWCFNKVYYPENPSSIPEFSPLTATITSFAGLGTILVLKKKKK